MIKFIIFILFFIKFINASLIPVTSVQPFLGFLDNSTQIETFLGIQFAVANRFEKAELIYYDDNENDRIVNATVFGPPCHSLVARNGFIKGDPAESEADVCLSINVYRPASLSKREKLLPVLFFVHGGAFVLGSSKNQITTPDPATFAATADVVVVTFNYRLGPFGFLKYFDVPTNLGFHDQVAALRWTHHHIERFGGDKNRITIAGQSAGAMSCCFLSTSKLAKPYFESVILQSPLCDYQFQKVEDGILQTKEAMKVLNCSDLQCLKTVSADALKFSLPQRRGTLWGKGYLWFPVVGDQHDELSDMHPFLKLQQSEPATNNKRFLLGTTKDEGSLFAYIGFPVWLPEFHAKFLIRETFGEHEFDRIFEQYALHRPEFMPEKIGWATFTKHFLSDIWTCSNHRLAHALDNISQFDVFMYEFLHTPEYQNRWPVKWLGSRHGVELDFLYGHAPLTTDEVALRGRIREGWRAFIHGEHDEHWRAFDDDDADSPTHIRTWNVIETPLNYTRRPPICDLWDTLLTDDGLLKIPPEIREPLWLYVLNVRLLGWIFSLYGALFFIVFVLIFVYRCCCRPKKSNTKQKTQ